MTQMIINGRQVDAADGRSLEVVSPVDGQVFTTIPRGQQADVDAAVQAARGALDGAWGRMTALERGRLLLRLGESVLAHHEELARLESRDTGKPMSTARADITVLAPDLAVTIDRAMCVAWRKSSAAPVVMSPSMSSSATRPPSAIAMRSSAQSLE